MKQDIKDQWIAELESGKHEQGRGALHIASGAKCCLGVLCDMAYRAGVIGREQHGKLYNYEGEEAVLPRKVMEWAGIDYSNPHVGDTALAAHNDGYLKSSIDNPYDGERMPPKPFVEIAKLIREHL